MKQIKKLLIMLLVFVVAVSMVSAAAFATGSSFEVEAENVSGAADKDVVMTVKVNSNPGVVAAILNVKYDSSKLTLTSVTDVKFINDATEYNIGNGECTIVLDNALATADVTNTGDLLKLNFTVAAEASGEIDVDLTVKEAVNYDLETVAANAVDGKVTVGVPAGDGPSIDDVDTSNLPETLPAENISFEGNTMTVAPAANTPACVVLVKDAQGNYTKVAATKNGDNYEFDMSNLGDGEIVVAVKGDANGDGSFTVADRIAMARALLSVDHASYQALNGLGAAAGNADGNDSITVADRIAIARALLSADHASYQAIAW